MAQKSEALETRHEEVEEESEVGALIEVAEEVIEVAEEPQLVEVHREAEGELAEEGRALLIRTFLAAADFEDKEIVEEAGVPLAVVRVGLVEVVEGASEGRLNPMRL
ncbi:hypothetical protein HWV62_12602 [Athelia sp. TMB]|nr:hypothetical protein HWV62_12602 [Athelia sp. TMB]